MTEKELLAKENELYRALVYLRIKEDVDIIEKEIQEKTPRDYSTETNVFKKGLGKGILNPVKQAQVKELEKDRDKALENKKLYEEKYSNNYDFSRGGIITKIIDCFRNDEKQEARNMLALRVCLTADYDYVNPEDSLKPVSILLFGDENRCQELFEMLKKNYHFINKKSLKSVDKKALKGLGIATAATILAGPIGLVVATATSKDVKDALNEVANAGAGEYGEDVAKVTSAAVAAEMLLTGATCGILTAVDIQKNKDIMAELRGIDPESLALKLGFKLTIIENTLKNLKEEETHAYLDEALQVLNDVRADAEYMLVVEKDNVEVQKKKVQVCNYFVERLVQLIGA